MIKAEIGRKHDKNIREKEKQENNRKVSKSKKRGERKLIKDRNRKKTQ